MFGFLTFGTTLTFLDQAFKARIEKEEKGTFPRELAISKGKIKLYQNHNEGFSFGILKGSRAVQLVPLCVTSAFAGAWAYLMGTRGRILEKLALTLTLAGGVSNLYDRMKRGYNVIIDKLFAGCEVRLGTDYLENKKEYDALAEKVVYTGTIDSYFGYRFGRLQYRSLRFETEVLDTDNFQGNAVINYTDRETPYTRIIEHKHFEFGTQEKTVITKEYPAEWTEGMEPYYPVNDEKNQELYKRYEALAAEEKNVIFGGRLAEYRYYDMDKVIESAFACVKKEFHGITIAADHR